ncbi:hypothetical protein BV133_304 [Blastochloris viridis]|uniref:Uncharacterized protein n=1 Tax=Blastochloris viridis TaxID=1079 RepID=A0A182CYM9_BLAVI|nr:hypothetical protein BV133_304 [Blastochloris viridis]
MPSAARLALRLAVICLDSEVDSPRPADSWIVLHKPAGDAAISRK